jgi:hypothetical protein
MGEQDWWLRYKEARTYADEQATLYQQGVLIENWRYAHDWKDGEPEPHKERIVGAAWVAYAYEIAADTARALVQTQGRQWQSMVDECERLAAQYRERKKQHGA